MEIRKASQRSNQGITSADPVLWYDHPAAVFTEGLSVGNGRLGALAYGGIPDERIELNEDSLWSGFPRNTDNPEASVHLEEVRKLIFSKEYVAAQKLVESTMLGPWSESYLPLGTLDVGYNNLQEVRDYHRQLDLCEAVVKKTFRVNGYFHQTELFASKVDQVLVYRLESADPSGLDLTIALDSQLKHHAMPEPEGLGMVGRCPINVAPNYLESIGIGVGEPVRYDPEGRSRGLSFAVTLMVRFEREGQITHANGRLRIKTAGPVTLLLTANTNYKDWKTMPSQSGIDPYALCKKQLASLEPKTYSKIRSDHLLDYRELFDRVSLDLGGQDEDSHPTDERIRAVADGANDPGLCALYFQYGRYLLISSSRPGTQAANLQGIWNNELRPAWSSNWTTNINTQMNYWSAETCNLPECHEPLFRLTSELSEKGQETARVNLNCSGWVANHNVDLWRLTTPVGYSARWAYWPFGGVWLSMHLWEHYLFSQDVPFLAEQAYPVMRGAAEFCMDWLIEDDTGYLVTAPSTSPENAFLTQSGEVCSVGKASTLDLTLMRELFEAVLEAGRMVPADKKFLDRIGRAVVRLPPFRVGSLGQLQEWDEDYLEEDPGHRHFSYLYALYPGHQISLDRRTELLDACRKVLDRRISGGGASVGWSCAWSIGLYAHLGMGEAAWGRLQTLLGQSTYPNLLDLHPPIAGVDRNVFQIDGNFGGTAAIAEMLLQSGDQVLRLLPALPDAWPQGSVAGLKARGAYSVDMTWTDGKLDWAEISAMYGGNVEVVHAGRACRFLLSPLVKIRIDSQLRIVNTKEPLMPRS